jgi:hypothetical protein
MFQVYKLASSLSFFIILFSSQERGVGGKHRIISEKKVTHFDLSPTSHPLTHKQTHPEKDANAIFATQEYSNK